MIIIAGHLLVDEADRDRYVEAHRAPVSRARAFEGCIDLSITANSIDSDQQLRGLARCRQVGLLALVKPTAQSTESNCRAEP
jgi:hypothetical protein